MTAKWAASFPLQVNAGAVMTGNENACQHDVVVLDGDGSSCPLFSIVALSGVMMMTMTLTIMMMTIMTIMTLPGMVLKTHAPLQV